MYTHYPILVFFFNDTATTEIYTLSLHDALPISSLSGVWPRRSTAPRDSRSTWTRSTDERPRTSRGSFGRWPRTLRISVGPRPDRKSTRLNSSHGYISYAVFCLKKKKKQKPSHNC